MQRHSSKRPSFKRLTVKRSVTTAGLALALAGLSGCAKGKDPPAPTVKVLIQGGSFTMGTDNLDPCSVSRIAPGGSNVLTCDGLTQSAAIQHTVAVKPFCIDAHEVTNLQHRHCVDLEECSEPESTNIGNQGQEGFIKAYYSEPDTFGGFPLVNVTHENAQKYCESKGGTLPTEAQWEYAASSRGEVAGDAPIWEGGDPELTSRFIAENCDGDVSVARCGERVAAAGSLSGDRTAQGVFDMSGSVYEWTRDEFDYLAGCDQDGIEDKFRVDDTRAVFADPQNTPPAGVVSDVACYDNGDAGYKGGCDPSFNSCLRVCSDAFGSTTAPQDEKLQNYYTGNCAARFPDANPVTNPEMVNEPNACTTECIDAGGEMDSCRAYCSCLVTGAPDSVSFDSTKCIEICANDYRACADDCDDGVQATCMRLFANNSAESQPFLPAPVCQPRAGRNGEDAHVRPAAFDVDPIQNGHVVRGGAFSSDDLCDVRVSRRDFRKTSNPFVGFRCVYPASACQ
ncbi:MAG: sulfatase activating formylglycine-generating enzyme [Bradymonadia bacterium]|jgi:formylglycine-generating enzyme required for sulfatase activity